MTFGGYSAKAVAWCGAEVGGSIPPTAPITFKLYNNNGENNHDDGKAADCRHVEEHGNRGGGVFPPKPIPGCEKRPVLRNAHGKGPWVEVQI